MRFDCFLGAAQDAGLIAVAVGAFADPAFPSPSQQVYQETRHPWVSFPTDALPYRRQR
jgi:hypothetical protein